MNTIQNDPELYRLKIHPRVRDDIHSTVIEVTQNVVNACGDRDEELLQLREQLEGLSMPFGGPWRNSCQLEDPMSREFHVAVMAAISQVQQRYPYWILEPIEEADNEIDSIVEAWINIRAKEFGYDQAVYDTTYIALESRFAPMAFHWVQKTKRVRVPYWINKDTGDILPPGTDFEPDENYEQILVTQEGDIEKEGIEFRTIDPWNFYLYPLGAYDIENAEAVIERIWLTPAELKRGIELWGFDKDAVETMLERGPSENSYKKYNAQEGLYEKSDEYYECYQIYGRIPYQKDLKIPEYLENEDFVFCVCPALNIVFKNAFAPYPFRPYSIHHMLRTPNQLMGHGIVSLLSPIQDEATATFRFAKDVLDISAAPMMLVPERYKNLYGDIEIGPGRTIGYKTSPEEVQPLVWQMSGYTALMDYIQYLYARAGNISAASAINSITSSKVMKAAQIEASSSILQSRFNLFLTGIQFGQKRDGEIILEIMKHHLLDKQPIRIGKNVQFIRKDDLLARQYRLVPTATSDDVNPDIRRQKDVELATLLRASPLFTAHIQQGNLQYEWNLLKRILTHRDVKDYENYIGPLPAVSTSQQSTENIQELAQMLNSREFNIAPSSLLRNIMNGRNE